MMRSHALRSSCALALAIGLMTACGTPPTTNPVKTPPEAVRALPEMVLAPAPFGISQANGQTNQNPLNLSAAQQRQLQEILQQETPNERLNRLQEMLLAPQIDPEALRAQLRGNESEIDAAISTMMRVREILTPQQRQQLVADVQQAAPQTDAQAQATQLSEMRQRLNLNTEQQQAFTALSNALEAQQQAIARRLGTAYARLMTTGDTEPIREVYREAERSRPLNEMVAFYASLSQSQRQTLFGSQQGSSGGSGSS